MNDVGHGVEPGQPAEPAAVSEHGAGSEYGAPQGTTEQGVDASSGSTRQHPGRIPLTRASATWVAVFGAMVALVIVLVFILENLHSVKVTFFGAHWSVPLGVDLLLAAVLGGLIVVLVGTVRILQLRREARRRGSASLG